MQVINSVPSSHRAATFRALTVGTALLSLVACGGGGDDPVAPPVNTSGTLTVTADQSTCGTISWSAEVFINGASQGRRQLGPFNPLTFPLQAGQYSVSVQLTDGTRIYTSSPVSTSILVGQSTNRIVTCL